MFNWTKRPSDALRKRREGDAAQRLSNASSDRLPDRPSLDGYTVGEVPPEQAAQLFGKIDRRDRGIDRPQHSDPSSPACDGSWSQGGIGRRAMGTDTDGPAVGRTVWVRDDSAPERKVLGRIVHVACGRFLAGSDSVVVDVGRGRVCSLLLAKRRIEWDYASS